jgi:hypothetical protein
MCKEISVIPVNSGGHKKNNRKNWRAEEMHKGSLTKKYIYNQTNRSKPRSPIVKTSSNRFLQKPSEVKVRPRQQEVPILVTIVQGVESFDGGDESDAWGRFKKSSSAVSYEQNLIEF